MRLGSRKKFEKKAKKALVDLSESFLCCTGAPDVSCLPYKPYKIYIFRPRKPPTPIDKLRMRGHRLNNARVSASRMPKFKIPNPARGLQVPPDPRSQKVSIRYNASHCHRWACGCGPPTKCHLCQIIRHNEAGCT